MEIEPGYEIVQDPKAPKGRRIVKTGQAVKGEVKSKAGLGSDSGDQFSDAQLRDAIKQETGKAPGPRTSRETLIKTFNEINANGS